MNIWDPMNSQTATISDRVAVSRRQSLLQVMSPKSWRPMSSTPKQSVPMLICFTSQETALLGMSSGTAATGPAAGTAAALEKLSHRSLW